MLGVLACGHLTMSIADVVVAVVFFFIVRVESSSLGEALVVGRMIDAQVSQEILTTDLLEQ